VADNYPLHFSLFLYQVLNVVYSLRVSPLQGEKTVEMATNGAEITMDTEKSELAHTGIFSTEDSEKQVTGINDDSSDLEKVHIDVVAEARLLRKLDTRLIPLLFALCKCSVANKSSVVYEADVTDLMSYMDRSNVG
jgi:hypothetical protein